MSRVVASRLAFAALLLVPCSLLLLRHLPWGNQVTPGTEDESPRIPSVQWSRETKPTIVRPSDNWMDETAPRAPLGPHDAGTALETDPPPDVPYLPPPLQATNVRPEDRL